MHFRFGMDTYIWPSKQAGCKHERDHCLKIDVMVSGLSLYTQLVLAF